MVFDLLHLGFDNRVVATRVVAIMSPSSEPVKRLVQEAKSNGRLLNVTHNNKTKAVILLDTGHVVTAAFNPETIAARMSALRPAEGHRAEQGQAQA